MGTSGHEEGNKGTTRDAEARVDHVQVVVVQQNPAEDDGGILDSIVDMLSGDNGDDDNKNKNRSGRRLTAALNRHNLLVVIALLILAASQVASVLQRFYENKEAHANLEGVSAADAHLAAAVAALQAATVTLQAAAAQQKPAPGLDRGTQALIIAALGKNTAAVPPSGDTKFVFLQPTPPNGPASPVPYAPYPLTPSTSQHNGPTLADIEITPSLTDTQFPKSGPINLTVSYQNKEKVGLFLLDRQAYLTTENDDAGAQGPAGICSYPKTGPAAFWPSGDHPISHPFKLELGPFLTKREQKNAEQGARALYITLCTTYRFNESAPVINRRVYKIIPSGSGERKLKEEPEDNEDFVPQ